MNLCGFDDPERAEQIHVCDSIFSISLPKNPRSPGVAIAGQARSPSGAMNSTTPATIYRVAVIALLSFVAFQLHRIESKLPPTRGAIFAAKTPEERAKLAGAMPMVVVTGEVSIDGAVRVEDPVKVVVSN